MQQGERSECPYAESSRLGWVRLRAEYTAQRRPWLTGSERRWSSMVGEQAMNLRHDVEEADEHDGQADDGACGQDLSPHRDDAARDEHTNQDHGTEVMHFGHHPHAGFGGIA